MNDKQYIVAIDEGTSSCRAMLINNKAQNVAVEQKEFTQFFPHSGWVEHDPMEIWNSQLQVFEALLSNNNIVPEQILGIGITNQRETTLVWDRNSGEPIYNAIVWQDRRTADLCSTLKAQGHETYIRDNTGLVIDAYFSGTKLKWILDNVEGARAKAENNELCFGTIDSWLIFKMTQGQKHLTDHTNASRTMLYNIKELDWDDHMLDVLDIPASVLPSVQASASDFGSFIYKGHSIPICGVAGDQQSALFGQACFEKGEVKNTYGTGCFMLMNTADEHVISEKGLLSTLCCNETGGHAYALEGSIFVAGAAVQWLRDGLQIISSSEESEVFALKAKADSATIVVPAFTGLGAPYWDSYARGAIFGLERSTRKEEIVKATLDAMAYQTRDVLDLMSQESGIEIRSLMVDGGAVANNYLMQFQADILQCDVVRPRDIESTALGAGFLAGIQLGIWGC